MGIGPLRNLQQPAAGENGNFALISRNRRTVVV
jgi:hypothetical protein